jgi:hypothetical protein
MSDKVCVFDKDSRSVILFDITTKLFETRQVADPSDNKPAQSQYGKRETLFPHNFQSI